MNAATTDKKQSTVQWISMDSSGVLNAATMNVGITLAQAAATESVLRMEL